MHIRPYAATDEADLIALWQACALTRPWNDPRRDIARKLAVQPEFLLIGELDGRLVASAMLGYDGHRASLYYLAVAPNCQRRGYGRALIAHAEALLLAQDCPKLNLQVRSENLAVLAFYASLGYRVEAVQGLGKRLIVD